MAGSPVPLMDFSDLASFGSNFQKARRDQRLADLPDQLGPKLKAGDYPGAAEAAFTAGDTNTGLALLKLGESYRQTKLGEQAAGRLMQGLSGSGAGMDSASVPETQQTALGRLGSSLPTFAQGSDIGRYAAAIQGNESGGNYGIVGPTHPKMGRALGAYQVMESNLPAWSREAIGRTVTPDEFLASPEIQDAIFQTKFGQSVEKYGNPEDAASVWFTGRPLAQGANARDVLGTTGREYVRRFNAGLARESGGRQPELPATAMQMPETMGGGAPAMAQAQPGHVRVASLDPSARLPVEGMSPGFAPAGGLSGRQSASGDGLPALPQVGAPGRTMTMPRSEPAQVAQAGDAAGRGAVSDDTMIGNVPAGAIRSAELSSRIPYLERAMVEPYLPDHMREGAKVLLQEAYAQTRMPDEVKEYRIARVQGYRGSLLDWKRDVKEGNPGGFTSLNGRLIYTDKSAGTARDATPEGMPPTWRPLTPQERQSLGVKDDAAVYMTPEGPKLLSGQTINVGGAERAQDVAIGTDYGKRFVEMQRGGQSARSTSVTIDTMERAMNSPGFYSGTGGPARLAFNRALESAGIKDKNSAAPAEVFEALSNRLILDGLGGSLGTGISNGDRDFIQRTAPTLTNTIEGNRELLRIARSLSQRQEQVAKLARDYAKANGGRLDMGFDEKLAEWAEANPLTPGGSATPAPSAGQREAPAASASGVPAAAAQHLRANPNLRGAFDEKYGAGASDAVLGPARRGGAGLDPSLGLQ